MTFQLFPGDTIITYPTSCRCGASEGMYVQRGASMTSLGCVCHHVLTLETNVRDVSSEQPDPTPNDHPAVWALVVDDMVDRDAVGLTRYGTRLQPHNGRDVLRDAYEEALDLAAYLRQALYERDGK